MSAKRVFVSGATGLVGFHVVEHLLGCGYEVTAMVRASSNRDVLNAAGGRSCHVVVGDLTNGEALVPMLAGHDAVVHAAGCVDPYGRRSDIFAVNVEGTRALLEAAVRAGVKQFVQISSLSVVTDQCDCYAVTEDAPTKMCGESYADSKVVAERLVMAEAAGARINVTALRPGFIYGPNERAWMPRLISSLSSGNVMLIDGGERETNVIYIGNLCRAVESSLLNEKAFGQVYNLTDGERVTKKRLFDALCNGLGMPPVTRTIPRPVVRLISEIVSNVAPFLPADTQKKLSRFSRAAFRLAAVNQGFSIAKAERDLNYTNRISFDLGIKRTLESFGVPTRPDRTRNSESGPDDTAAGRPPVVNSTGLSGGNAGGEG